MPKPLDPETRRALAARVEYYRELGIFDFYRREIPGEDNSPSLSLQNREREGWATQERARRAPEPAVIVAAESPIDMFAPAKPEAFITDPKAALRAIREDLGDCSRCKLYKLGRKQIVFGVGNPQTEIMFIGEGPGADEDQQGEPFVGRAGQLLNKMIEAMGLRRADVYIANVVKCRPPGNRTPERDECETCSPFLMRQIDVIRPKVIVALGAVAAKTLLGLNASMAELREHSYDFRGARLFATYHPAFLLRDPRQKTEAWKDLQKVMKFLGLKAPGK